MNTTGVSSSEEVDSRLELDEELIMRVRVVSAEVEGWELRNDTSGETKGEDVCIGVISKSVIQALFLRTMMIMAMITSPMMIAMNVPVAVGNRMEQFFNATNLL